MNTADEPDAVRRLTADFAELGRFLVDGSSSTMSPARIVQVVPRVVPARRRAP